MLLIGRRKSCSHSSLRQDYLESEVDEPLGHINTIRPQMPRFADVVCQMRYIPRYRSGELNEIENSWSAAVPLHRENLFKLLASPHVNEEIAWAVKQDTTRKFSPWKAIDLGKQGLLLEMYFGVPLQIEYVCAEHRTYIVQARPLPAGWTKAVHVTFPERNDYIWRGESFGVLDEVLEILPAEVENCNRTGLVILFSSWEASVSPDWLDKVMPKKGAVWLLTPSEYMRGHVESRCAERGVLVITGETPMEENNFEDRHNLFRRIWNAYGEDLSVRFAENDTGKPLVLPPSNKLTRLRVVSNGLEARIYTE